jgi:hypothetical protein
MLSRGVDVVVGTPGRLLDLIDRGTLSLAGIKFVGGPCGRCPLRVYLGDAL